MVVVRTGQGAVGMGRNDLKGYSKCKSTGMAGELWDFGKGEGGVQHSSGCRADPPDMTTGQG